MMPVLTSTLDQMLASGACQDVSVLVAAAASATGRKTQTIQVNAAKAKTATSARFCRLGSSKRARKGMGRTATRMSEKALMPAPENL